MALGWPHPDHLLPNLTSAQFAEWEAFFSLEPWGFEMDNFRAGIVASTVANFSQASKRHDFAPRDFMPREPKAPTVADKIRQFFGAPKRAAGSE